MTDELKQWKEIIDVVNFEEKWLIDVKMDNGFISIADITTAMNGIRAVVREADKENKECEYYDSEAETCRRSETMAITREDVKNLYEDMMNVVKTEDEKAEMEIIYALYKGMTDSMQKAVKDIMLVANGKEIEE